MGYVCTIVATTLMKRKQEAAESYEFAAEIGLLKS